MGSTTLNKCRVYTVGSAKVTTSRDFYHSFYTHTYIYIYTLDICTVTIHQYCQLLVSRNNKNS